MLDPLAVGTIVGREMTPDERLERAEAEAERWQVFGTRQTGQLRKETAEKIGSQEIVTRCEERDAAAYRRINAPAWQFWR